MNSPPQNPSKNAKRVKEIFSQYSDFILAVYTSKVNDPDLAQELYQDLFIKLSSKKIPEKIDNIKGYLYKTITNSIYDRIRSIEANKKNMQKYQQNSDFSINDYHVSSVYYNKGEILYEKGVKLLTRTEKTVFKLMFKQGKDLDQISNITGLKKNTISRYISVSIKKIRKHIDNEKGKNE